MADWKPLDRMAILGKRYTRLDGPDKVSGRAKYTYDMRPDGLLYGLFLSCPHAAATIERIDGSRAERVPGVAAVLTNLHRSGSPSPPGARAGEDEETGPRIPPHEYRISIHYDLGMHCTGFDFSYCCILPPYNSILAQIVRTSRGQHDKPRVLKESDLAPADRILWYEHDRNTYSEGPKMLYWNLPDDVNGDGDLADPNDSCANVTWSHLYTYLEAPLRFRPYPRGLVSKRYLGLDLPIPQDHGPTGKPLSHGKLDYTGPEGTVLYTVTNDGETETPLIVAQREYWEALGILLTPFLDGSTGNIRMAREELMRPYQRARVSLAKWNDENGDTIAQTSEVTLLRDRRAGEPATFTGTNPIDVPSCQRCHATERANKDQYGLYRKEYRYWKDRFPNTTDYYAAVKASWISLLEIHDAKHGTDFLSRYDPDDATGASVTRLGQPSVRCQDCHADNIVGQLRGHIPEGKERAIASLSAAMYLSHLESTPDPDRFGRTSSCQGCHPAHQQSGSLERFPLDEKGNFRGGDVRDYGGGCFLGRDLHGNPATSEILGTRSHLNAIGIWLRDNVMTGGKGLYCTSCQNVASRLLYKADRLESVLEPGGETLRDQPLEAMIAAFRKMEKGRYAEFTVEDFLDPRVTSERRPVHAVWSDPPSDPYRVIDDAGDYWLAAGEPKCADCHLPPFVESMGGSYPPIDQQEKLSFMRYSKGHWGISCQSCHQSMHGMHPVADAGVDPTTLAQARVMNPDGPCGPAPLRGLPHGGPGGSAAPGGRGEARPLPG